MKKEIIEFEVVYKPSTIVQVEKIMSGLDLGIAGVSYSRYRKVSWTTTAKIDKKYIAKMKKAVKQAFELDGSKVISVNKIYN